MERELHNVKDGLVILNKAENWVERSSLPKELWQAHTSAYKNYRYYVSFVGGRTKGTKLIKLNKEMVICI